jgi:signal transduction histidine kinase
MITWPDQRKVKLQIAFDITGRKQWESERQASEESLHQVEKAEALGRMAGAIAHHFNNQLTVIIGNLQLALEASPGNGPVREYLQNAIRVAIDSSEISMLLFQYLGEHGGELQPFDLAEFCRRQVPSMKMRLLANITIDTDISDTSLTIHADRVMVQQILSQLIANSHEAMNGQGGTILLSVRSVSAMALQGRQLEPKNWRPRQESYCCLEVSDTGCGIDENNRGKIFDPFFTTKLSSRGLGLAIVLGIVKAADGAVEVIGNVPRGCVVRIYLPNFHDTPFGEEK